jgi:hypothetical protein
VEVSSGPVSHITILLLRGPWPAGLSGRAVRGQDRCQFGWRSRTPPERPPGAGAILVSSVRPNVDVLASRRTVDAPADAMIGVRGDTRDSIRQLRRRFPCGTFVRAHRGFWSARYGKPSKACRPAWQ